MRRLGLVIGGVVVVLLVASQFVIPALAEHVAAGRLTKHGGHAEVSIDSFPALRLLFGHGDSLRVDGRGVDLPTEGEHDLDRLDKFGGVHGRLRDSRGGPVAIRGFRLDRADGDASYPARLSGATTPREVAAFLGSRAGGALGGLFGDLAAGTALGERSSTRVPLRLRANVTDEGVYAAGGTVAGVPAGPLFQLVLDAVLRGLWSPLPASGPSSERSTSSWSGSGLPRGSVVGSPPCCWSSCSGVSIIRAASPRA